MTEENFHEFEEANAILDEDRAFLFQADELEKVDFKDVLKARMIIEGLLNQIGVDSIFSKNLHKKVESELEKEEEKTYLINGMTFICSNEVEHYFARRLSVSGDIGANKYIDKKIRIVMDKDILCKDISFSIDGDVIVAKIGFCCEPKMDKYSFISDKSELRDKFLDEVLLPDVKDLFEEMYEVSPEMAKFAGVGRVISSLTESYEDSVTDDLAADIQKEDPMSSFDLIGFTIGFLDSVDKTGHLSKVLKEAIANQDLKLLRTKEEVDEASMEYNVDIKDVGGCVVNRERKILIPCSGTASDFITLVHELMHYNSLVNSKTNIANEDDCCFFTEFPSIYFEYLAKYYAEKHGLKTNNSIDRNEFAIKKFWDVVMATELSNLCVAGKLNSKSFMILAEKYNFSLGEMCNFSVRINETFRHVPYLLGLLSTKYSLDKGISADTIRDLSTHLYDLKSDEVIQKLNMSELILSDTLEANNSHSL